MPLLDNQAPEIKLSFGDNFAQKQRRQMLIALTLLLAALILTLTKDHEFWFPSTPTLQSESEPIEETSSEPRAQSEAATTATQPTVPTRLKAKPHTPAAVAAAPNSAAASTPVVTSRTVLPPLKVEVVTGDEHRSVQAGSSSVEVDLSKSSTPAQASSAPPTSDAAGVDAASARVHLSPGATQILKRPVEPIYPLLAKQMKIQGSVVLDALIGRDGNIQHLRVLSGPTILSAAAQEAIKQWRFRPYLQSGQAVETQARVTVNFMIFTR